MRIGAAMYDITGPAAEVGMFGYANMNQTASGIHMRLRSRAFVFNSNSEYFAFVSVDTGCITEFVTQTVLAQLQDQQQYFPQSIFQVHNIMLSATHTHCSPGGHSGCPLYSMHPPLKGFESQNFECIVNGIVESIVRAFRNLQPAAIKIARGNCMGASINRSVDAYNANPLEERLLYEFDTDKEMTLWRIDGEDGYPIGMINWFAVHPTSMGSWFTLITGDNKGYASHVFEREHGTIHLMDRPRSFVAAFAQSNEGDVSPNVCGPRTNANEKKDFERMKIVGGAQLDTARRLYAEAANALPVSGTIRFAHQYVNYNSIKLQDMWHINKDCPKSTSSGCLGVSMLSGTHYDGRGLNIIPEGLKWSKSWFTLLPNLQTEQREKPILLPSAACGMSPSILPLQLVTIGDQIALAAIPFEATTMSGRRLRKSISAALGINHIILAGLSNAYCGYLTTREEYAIQRYEGASTHFGPNQLVATQQQFDILAAALRTNQPAPTCQPPQNFTTSNWHTPVLYDDGPSNVSFGQLVTDVKTDVPSSGGDFVQAIFHAGHPKNDLRTQSTFLEIQRWLQLPGKEGGLWVIHADDSDENTYFNWKRDGLACSQVTIVWHIPSSIPNGKYRIKHNGHYKLKWRTKVLVAYSGCSSAFEVTTPNEKEKFKEVLESVTSEPGRTTLKEWKQVASHCTTGAIKKLTFV